jgi:hypothetical protein
MDTIGIGIKLRKSIKGGYDTDSQASHSDSEEEKEKEARWAQARYYAAPWKDGPKDNKELENRLRRQAGGVLEMHNRAKIAAHEYRSSVRWLESAKERIDELEKKLAVEQARANKRAQEREKAGEEERNKRKAEQRKEALGKRRKH